MDQYLIIVHEAMFLILIISSVIIFLVVTCVCRSRRYVIKINFVVKLILDEMDTLVTEI